MKATIYKSTGSWYIAKTMDGSFYNCRIKGKFKINKYITSTNPIAVGDIVNIELENVEEQTGIITHIEERKNYLIRQSPHNKYQQHIVAANLDQSLIIATLKEPKTSSGFIDRFLISCEAYHIPAIIVFNKADLLNEEEIAYFEFLKTIYTQIGYDVFLISAEQNKGVEIFEQILKDKITLLTGHSGVGKSTLINSVIPEKELITQEVSAWSGKGMHTTTFAEMHDLKQGGQLIDTPGIRELGIVSITKNELAGYFPEIKKAMVNCKYNNCLHINEPQCAVKEDVSLQIISEERYINYVKIFETIIERNY